MHVESDGLVWRREAHAKAVERAARALEGDEVEQPTRPLAVTEKGEGPRCGCLTVEQCTLWMSGYAERE